MNNLNNWHIWSSEQSAFFTPTGFVEDRAHAHSYTSVEVRQLCAGRGRGMTAIPAVGDRPVLNSLTAWVETKLSRTLDCLSTLESPRAKIFCNHFSGVINNGFTPWLEALEGQQLTEGGAQELAEIYYVYCNRNEPELPAILGALQRIHNIGIPVVHGILSQQYWENYFSGTASAAA